MNSCRKSSQSGGEETTTATETTRPESKNIIGLKKAKMVVLRLWHAF